MRTLIDNATALFKQSLGEIADTLDRRDLSPELVTSLAKDLLAASADAARAFFRDLLQDRDTDAPLVEHEGRRFRRKSLSKRTVLTFLGPVSLQRGLYQQDRGGAAFFPLDAACGFHGSFATPDVREASLYLLAHATPTECEAILGKIALFRPSATAIGNMAGDAGAVVDAEAEAITAEIRAAETAPAGTRVLAASLDGANVLLNEPGPRKGRPAERPGQEAAETSSYRNAMVGSVTFYGAVPEGERGPERLVSRYVAHMPEEGFPTLRARFEAEVEHAERLAGAGVRKVLLCDGARSLWTYAERSERFADFAKVLDFYHATEHLSKAAEAIFGKAANEATAWYRRWRGKLLTEEGAVASLLRSLDRYGQEALPKARREELARQRTYFARNAPMMRYAEYRRDGLPIGSGVVEAACKTIVKQRLCRSGMRWSRSGGERILHLRTMVRSGRWDRFWTTLSRLRDQRELLRLAA